MLFGVYSFTQAGRTVPASSKEIASDRSTSLRQLALLFQSQWRREPTPEEFTQLVENKVQEEILYREALAMGLDKDDEIVKRRMAQKMQFLAEDVAAAHEPATAELKSWYEKNREQFAQPSRFSFRHLYFSPDRRGAARARRCGAGAGEARRPARGLEARGSLADPFMFQEYYRDRASEYLGKEFGPQFAQAVAKLAPGSWQGPIESGFGWHLVFVDTVMPGRMPAFEEIEPDVKTAWLAEQKALAWEQGVRGYARQVHGAAARAAR